MPQLPVTSAPQQFVDPRQLTPAQRFVEGTLMMPSHQTEELAKYSDWLSAGAGAAILAIIGNAGIAAAFKTSFHGMGIMLVAASLLFGALAKIFVFTANSLALAAGASLRLMSELAGSVSSPEDLVRQLGLVQEETKPRLRLFQRIVFAVLHMRPVTDKLALATMVNACVQYAFAIILIQLGCIIGGLVSAILSL